MSDMCNGPYESQETGIECSRVESCALIAVICVVLFVLCAAGWLAWQAWLRYLWLREVLTTAGFVLLGYGASSALCHLIFWFMDARVHGEARGSGGP